MAKNKRLILVYKDMPNVKIDDKVSIVLTPQNYILKREKLPIKKEYQAKRVVGSIFDNVLDDMESYSFFIYKDLDEWIFIAYKIDEILTLLEEKNIPISQVQEVFFAQQFIKELSNPIDMGSVALINLNNIATVVSKMILPKESIYLDEINFKSKVKPVFLKQTNSKIDSTVTKMVSVSLIILAILYFVETQLVIKKGVGDSNIDEISSDYPALQSSYTRASVLSKYRKIDKIQRLKRDLLKSVFAISKKGVKLEKLNMSSTNYDIVLSLTNRSKDEVVKELKSKGLKVHSATSKEIILKGKL
jgi:hypothetical protein